MKKLLIILAAILLLSCQSPIIGPDGKPSTKKVTTGKDEKITVVIIIE